jgi:hypothetical protein
MKLKMKTLHKLQSPETQVSCKGLGLHKLQTEQGGKSQMFKQELAFQSRIYEYIGMASSHQYQELLKTLNAESKDCKIEGQRY